MSTNHNSKTQKGLKFLTVKIYFLTMLSLISQLIKNFNSTSLALQDLKEDPKDEYLGLLRATIKCLTYPEKYFEKVVRLSINKTGTDEGALTRVVATRAEVDMKTIKEEYQRRNSVPLEKAIAKDTRGDYEEMLLALIGCADAQN